jgi:hypothetical protein
VARATDSAPLLWCLNDNKWISASQKPGQLQ